MKSVASIKNIISWTAKQQYIAKDTYQLLLPSVCMARIQNYTEIFLFHGRVMEQRILPS